MDNTTAKSLKNAVASSKMEGINFTEDTLKIITDYAEKKIDIDELINQVSLICRIN